MAQSTAAPAAVTYALTPEIAARVKTGRADLGLTQTDLASKAGCKQQDIDRVENCRIASSRWVPLILSALDAKQDFRSDPSVLTLGQRIRVARDARGLTQTDVATALDVSQAVISNWELGLNDIDVGHVLKLSIFLGANLVAPPPANSPALADLLGYLHFLRAERGIDVPERYFETLCALQTRGGKAPTS